MTNSRSLRTALSLLNNAQPSAWGETGANTRPNLHGLLRYPAMMVPRMQGDIMDAILRKKNARCRVLDPFVGSGTVMTEALMRDLPFTGVDINPLAALVCEAKAAIDRGADIEGAAQVLLAFLRCDVAEEIIDFPGRSKWFDDQSAIRLGALRRSICSIPDAGARKVMWTIFAETVRLCSNSRTSTYKLHIRRPDDRVSASRVTETFEINLRQALIRVREYRVLLRSCSKKRPSVKIICEDIRSARLRWSASDHQILVTSPPYGDNQTTIPYGQFSYLALRCIPTTDLPSSIASQLLANTHSLDSVSLGGTLRGSEAKEDTARGISSSFDRFVQEAERQGCRREIRKVSSFIGDFCVALQHLRSSTAASAHWVLTTGNRTVAGITVPFDSICRDLIVSLGGKHIASVQRQLPNKRMPSRNSQGVMITAETTMVGEFS
jgi:hypothetical protein